MKTSETFLVPIIPSAFRENPYCTSLGNTLPDGAKALINNALGITDRISLLHHHLWVMSQTDCLMTYQTSLGE